MAQVKVGAYSFSGVLRGFWITQGRILQCRSEGHISNTHSMVERQSPTQGRSLYCHEAEGRHEPISYDTPCQRYDNRAVANTTRYPEGGTSRTDWTRKHQRTTKGGKGGSQERVGPTASTPAARSHKKGENNNTKTNEQQQKRGALQHQGRKTPEKHTDNGQPQQGHPRQSKRRTAERYRPKHTTQNNAKKDWRMSIPALRTDTPT